jgi:zinc transport system substrate-binding protein
VNRRRLDRGPAAAAPFAALLAVLLAGALVGCGAGDSAAGSRPRDSSGKLEVFVDSYPLRYFAERIGGDQVSVSFPAPADVDPAFWAPDADTVARYQDADLVLVTGAGYAKWTETATLPGSRLIDTSAALSDRLLQLEDAVTHSHGGMGEHSHAGYATTIWLDPTLASEQARAIAAAFSSARPAAAAAFAENLAALEGDLVALDTRLAAVAARIGQQPLLFSHPVFQYFARRYGLVARSLHWEASEVPGPFAWSGFEEKLEGHPASTMIWEAEPVAETVAELSRRGVRSVVFLPCANTPPAGDYLSVMGANAVRLEQAFPAS